MNYKYLFILLVFFGACTREEAADLYVESDLQPYFAAFEAEAAERGLDMEIQIEGFINTLENGDGILGQCVEDNLEPDQIIIDGSFWNRSDHYSREFIVFHELGHCVLGRSHLDDPGEDGLCASIMHSGSLACRRNYTEETRERYLDELFQK